jgi:putative SOS response-associated peptidase YedK
MCGRFARGYTWKEVQEWLRLASATDVDQLAFSYNVAPTQNSPVIRVNEDGRKEISMARWGLIPFWAEDPSIGNRMINARADAVASKPAFRNAFKERRCLVPISGFYEWQKISGSKVKQPWYIYPAVGKIMCLAGLWERWDKGDKPLDTFTIITTEANAFIEPLHDRMPVVICAVDVDRWMNPNTPVEKLQSLLVPAPHDMLAAHKVSTRVNSPKFDEPELINPNA